MDEKWGFIPGNNPQLIPPGDQMSLSFTGMNAPPGLPEFINFRLAKELGEKYSLLPLHIQWGKQRRFGYASMEKSQFLAQMGTKGVAWLSLVGQSQGLDGNE